MAHCAGGCVGPGKKDQVSGLCLLAGYDGTLAIDSLRCRPGQVVDAGLRIDPADIPAAVKGRGRGRAAPHIGKANIAGSLREQRPVASIPHGLPCLEAARPHPAIDCRGVDPLGVGPVLHSQGFPQQAFQIPADLLLIGEENGHRIGFLRDAPILFLHLPGTFLVAQEAFQKVLLHTAGGLPFAKVQGIEPGFNPARIDLPALQVVHAGDQAVQILETLSDIFDVFPVLLRHLF